MTEVILSYLIKIFGTALIIGAISTIAGKGVNATICKIAGGMIFIVAVLAPFKDNGFKIKFSDFWSSQEADGIMADAERKSYEIKNSTVSAKLAAYAEQTARENGVDAEIEIRAYADDNNNFYIVSAEAVYKNEEDYQKRDIVKKILSEECGIGEEKQKHSVQK